MLSLWGGKVGEEKKTITHTRQLWVVLLEETYSKQHKEIKLLTFPSYLSSKWFTVCAPDAITRRGMELEMSVMRSKK